MSDDDRESAALVLASLGGLKPDGGMLAALAATVAPPAPAQYQLPSFSALSVFPAHAALQPAPPQHLPVPGAPSSSTRLDSDVADATDDAAAAAAECGPDADHDADAHSEVTSGPLRQDDLPRSDVPRSDVPLPPVPPPVLPPPALAPVLAVEDDDQDNDDGDDDGPGGQGLADHRAPDARGIHAAKLLAARRNSITAAAAGDQGGAPESQLDDKPAAGATQATSNGSLASAATPERLAELADVLPAILPIGDAPTTTPAPPTGALPSDDAASRSEAAATPKAPPDTADSAIQVKSEAEAHDPVADIAPRLSTERATRRLSRALAPSEHTALPARWEELVPEITRNHQPSVFFPIDLKVMQASIVQKAPRHLQELFKVDPVLSQIQCFFRMPVPALFADSKDAGARAFGMPMELALRAAVGADGPPRTAIHDIIGWPDSAHPDLAAKLTHILERGLAGATNDSDSEGESSRDSELSGRKRQRTSSRVFVDSSIVRRHGESKPTFVSEDVLASLGEWNSALDAHPPPPKRSRKSQVREAEPRDAVQANPEQTPDMVAPTVPAKRPIGRPRKHPVARPSEQMSPLPPTPVASQAEIEDSKEFRASSRLTSQIAATLALGIRRTLRSSANEAPSADTAQADLGSATGHAGGSPPPSTPEMSFSLEVEKVESPKAARGARARQSLPNMASTVGGGPSALVAHPSRASLGGVVPETSAGSAAQRPRVTVDTFMRGESKAEREFAEYILGGAYMQHGGSTTWGKAAVQASTLWDGPAELRELYDGKPYLPAGLYSPAVNQAVLNRRHRPKSTPVFRFPLPIRLGEILINEQSDFELPYDYDKFIDALGGVEQLRSKYGRVRASPFQYIERNIWVDRRPPHVPIDSESVCQCRPPKDGSPACGDECINRCLFIECQDGCPNKGACTNQAIRRMLDVKELEVRFTSGRGFGLYTLVPIPAGRFIIEYRGEIISTMTCIQRMNTIYKGQSNQYFLGFASGLVIDGCRKGTVARFANHSCAPNCHIEKWYVEKDFRIGLFATNDIPAESELTYDYRFDSYGEMQPCLCGAATCRGFIGLNKRQAAPAAPAPKKTKSRRRSSAARSTSRVSGAASTAGSGSATPDAEASVAAVPHAEGEPEPMEEDAEHVTHTSVDPSEESAVELQAGEASNDPTVAKATEIAVALATEDEAVAGGQAVKMDLNEP